MYYTYAHYTADTNKIFYIGKGCGYRFKVKSKRSKFWQNVVAKHGYRAEILAKWPTEAEAFEHEKFLIECFRDLDFKLVNHSNGGEGNSGLVHSEETKRKFKQRTGEKNPNYGNRGEKNPLFGKPNAQAKELGKAWLGKKRPYVAERNKTRTGTNGYFYNKKHEILTCPHCNKQGGKNVMPRWHFENCKEKP